MNLRDAGFRKLAGRHNIALFSTFSFYLCGPCLRTGPHEFLSIQMQESVQVSRSGCSIPVLVSIPEPISRILFGIRQHGIKGLQCILCPRAEVVLAVHYNAVTCRKLFAIGSQLTKYLPVFKMHTMEHRSLERVEKIHSNTRRDPASIGLLDRSKSFPMRKKSEVKNGQLIYILFIKYILYKYIYYLLAPSLQAVTKTAPNARHLGATVKTLFR